MNTASSAHVLFEKLQVSISTERLGRYLGACNGNIESAIRFYELNLRLSQSLYGILHGYEVTLRNAMHDQLSVHFGQQNWYDKAPLDKWHLNALDDAEKKCTPPLTTGKMIAGLTLAFWTGLTAKRYEQDLWVPCVRKAFPNSGAGRMEMHRTLQDIQDLRNRVAHHERVLGSKARLYVGLHHTSRQERFIRPEVITATVRRICATTASWLEQTARFSDCVQLLDSEPLKSLQI